MRFTTIGTRSSHRDHGSNGTLLPRRGHGSPGDAEAGPPRTTARSFGSLLLAGAILTNVGCAGGTPPNPTPPHDASPKVGSATATNDGTGEAPAPGKPAAEPPELPETSKPDEPLPPRIQALVTQLKDSAPDVQAAAFESLIKAGTTTNDPNVKRGITLAIVDRLTDTKWRVRFQSAEAMRAFGTVHAIPALIERVADDLWTPDDRGEEEDAATQAVPPASSKDAALQALRKLWMAEAEASIKRQGASADKDEVRRRASEKAGEKVEGPLIRASKSKTVAVRKWALDRLPERKGTDDERNRDKSPSPRVQALADRLVDEQWKLRVQAAEGLNRIKAGCAVPALVKRVADDLWSADDKTDKAEDGAAQAEPPASSKDAALAALKALGTPKDVETALIQASKSKTVAVRKWASRRLAEQDSPPPGQ